MTDGAKIKDEIENKDIGGYFDVEVIRDGKHGPEVIQRRRTHNLITTVGKRTIWKICMGLLTGAGSTFESMRIGTNNTTTNSGQTNVLTPVVGTLETVDSITMSGRTVQIVISYASGGGSISAAGIAEVGVFATYTSPGTPMLARGTFVAVNKTRADKLKVSYTARIT